MEKPTPAALEAFDFGFPDDSRAERRQMFGMPAGFVNGNMFYGVFHDGVVLRLPPAALAEALGQDGIAAFEPMPGRPWKAYVHALAPIWGASAELKAWALQALDHTAQLPPKVKKPRAGRTA